LTVQLVPAQFEPLETFVDGIERGLRVPFDVSVVDAENYDTALPASIKPIENECSSAPDVKVTGGRGRKADARHTQNLKDSLLVPDDDETGFRPTAVFEVVQDFPSRTAEGVRCDAGPRHFDG